MGEVFEAFQPNEEIITYEKFEGLEGVVNEHLEGLAPKRAAGLGDDACLEELLRALRALHVGIARAWEQGFLIKICAFVINKKLKSFI